MSAPKVAPRRDMIWVWFRYSDAAVLMLLPLDGPHEGREGQLSRWAPGLSPSISSIPSATVALSAGGGPFSTISGVEFLSFADGGFSAGWRGVEIPRHFKSSRERSSNRTTCTRALRAEVGTATADPPSSARDVFASSLVAW